MESDLTLDFEEESYNNDSKSEDVTIEDLGSKIQGTAKDVGGKPIFDKNTPAKINSVTMSRLKEPKYTRDGSSEYYPIIVRVETETKEGLKSYDNYGGLRETDTGLWVGSKSAFGKLRDLILEELGDDASWKDIFEYLNSGIDVKIKSKTTIYNGQNYQKNIITQLL